MNTQHHSLSDLLNDVKQSSIVKTTNGMINRVLYSPYFNQFISIIIK